MKRQRHGNAAADAKITVAQAIELYTGVREIVSKAPAGRLYALMHSSIMRGLNEGIARGVAGGAAVPRRRSRPSVAMGCRHPGRGEAPIIFFPSNQCHDDARRIWHAACCAPATGGGVLLIDDRAAQDYVQYELLGYLARRPHARDTFDGILHWWLFDQRRSTGHATISAAVSALVALGRLRELRLADGAIVYAATTPSDPYLKED